MQAPTASCLVAVRLAPWPDAAFRNTLFSLLKKYLVEFVGTFFLVFAIGMTVIAPGAGAMAPLAIGSMLAVMLFAGARVAAFADKAVNATD